MTNRHGRALRARAIRGGGAHRFGLRETHARRCAPLGLGLLVLGHVLCAFGQAQDIEDRDWLELRSRNFVVITDEREPLAGAVVERLERFFQFAEIATDRRARERDLPRRLYYLEAPSLVQALVPSDALAGLFVSSPVGHLMIAKPTDDNAIIYHELTHLLMLSGSNMRYPLWYSEGFADYLGHADIRKNRVIVGNAYAGALATLRAGAPATLQSVFHRSELDRNDYDSVAMFYAQSWSLVHMLLNETRRDGLDFGESLRRYLERFNARENIDAAFSASFELSYEALEAELNRYIRRRSLPVREYDIEPGSFDLTYTSRPLPELDALMALAELIHFANPAHAALAEELLRSDIATATASLRPKCLLGVILAARGEYARARALADFDLGASEDSEEQRQCGTLLLYLAVNVRACESDAQTADRLADRASAAFDRALELAPQSPVALYYRALTRLLEPDPARPTLAYLLEASPWYPTDTTLNFALAASLEQNGDDRAALYLERLRAFQHESATMNDLERALAEYERPGERDVVMYPLAPACTAPPA